MTWRFLILLAAGGSAALLLGAFAFQLAGYPPCKLCIWQRWPHGAAIAAGGLALLTGWRLFAAAGGLAALSTAGIGAYHAGVELVTWSLLGISMAGWNAILSLGLAALWIVALLGPASTAASKRGDGARLGSRPR